MMNYPFLSCVTIAEGNAFSVNFEGDLRYLAELDCDRMLYNFRRTFGEEPDCEPIYGWDSPDGLLRGHSTGHFLSALALAYSATSKELYREKLCYTVSELRRLQLKSAGAPHGFKTECTPDDCAEEKWSRDPSVWGEGFLSAYSPDQFALLEQFTPYAKIWAPYYTLHKLLAGFIEVYERTGLETALDAAVGIGRWVIDRLSPLSAAHRARMWSLYIAGEFGGMNESLARLALITGDRSFLEGAKMFDNENIFPGLSRGIDTVKNLHANQHIPQILGALLEYRASGDDTYLHTAENFFDIVTRHHMYATGGVGQGECFREPDRLAHFIKGDTNCETCATYNLIKIARELYSLDPERADYMDYIERGLFDHILASRFPTATEGRLNGVTYMLPIGPGVEKLYTDDYYSFTCCHGTGMENHVKYGDCIYFIADDCVYVNQYIPSALSTDGVSVRLDLDFPSLAGRITVSSERAVSLKLRIPKWCMGMPFSVRDVNDRSPEVVGRYAIVRIAAGGSVTIDTRFNCTARYEYLSDPLSDYDLYMADKNTGYHGDREPDGSAALDRTPDKRLAALMYGAFVMVVCDASREFITLPEDAVYTPSVEGGHLTLHGAGRTFRPIYDVHGTPYHTYFIIS